MFDDFSDDDMLAGTQQGIEQALQAVALKAYPVAPRTLAHVLVELTGAVLTTLVREHPEMRSAILEKLDTLTLYVTAEGGRTQ